MSTMSLRPVTARLSLIACAVASLPVLVIWMSSQLGTMAQINPASSCSQAVLPLPKSDRSSSSVWRMAALTAGSLCPSRCGAKAAW